MPSTAQIQAQRRAAGRRKRAAVRAKLGVKKGKFNKKKMIRSRAPLVETKSRI